ncbi:MAG: hypothetical protein EA350_07550 [Gemmatimonadales bacterium]|nr:MAG: hypothetical protein EA350_07550 [Gemmatimonadales bacterium]
MRSAGRGGVLAFGLLVAGCASPGGGGAYAGIDPAARAPAGAEPAGERGAAGAPAAADAPADPAALPAGVRIFRGDGTPSTWEAVLEAASATRVVLLGEIHDDVLGHRARHALVRALAGGVAAAPGLPTGGAGDVCAPHVISLEMLEADVQLVVDEYQAGLINADHFRRAARPWANHDRDYEPFLETARACDFPVVAANPPRRYVNRVARMGEAGLEALGPEALAFLPPLPVARPSERYRAQWDALMAETPGHGGGGHGAAEPAHGAHGDPESGDPVLMAQNLWDAGMAWAVAEAAREHPEARVIHVVGAFHVQEHTGIPEHLARYLPGVEPLVIVAYPGAADADFDPDRHGGRGDFVLLTER